MALYNQGAAEAGSPHPDRRETDGDNNTDTPLKATCRYTILQGNDAKSHGLSTQRQVNALLADSPEDPAADHRSPFSTLRAQRTTGRVAFAG